MIPHPTIYLDRFYEDQLGKELCGDLRCILGFDYYQLAFEALTNFNEPPVRFDLTGLLPWGSPLVYSLPFWQKLWDEQKAI